MNPYLSLLVLCRGIFPTEKHHNILALILAPKNNLGKQLLFQNAQFRGFYRFLIYSLKLAFAQFNRFTLDIHEWCICVRCNKIIKSLIYFLFLREEVHDRSLFPVVASS
jgi:hypothetical protein